MSSFLNNVVGQFANQGQGQPPMQNHGQYPPQHHSSPPPHNQYPPPAGQFSPQHHPPPPGAPPPPQVPHPWVAIWSPRDNRYYFENRETRQTTWELPHYGGSLPPTYPPGAQGRPGRAPSPSTTYQHNNVRVEEQQKKSHNYGGIALGAAAGVAGGALLAHEGHKVHEKFEEDKYCAEDRFREHEHGGREYGRRPNEYVTETTTTYVDDGRPRAGYVDERRENYYVDDSRRDDYTVRRDDYQVRDDYERRDFERREYDNSYTDRVEDRVDYDTYRAEQRVEDFPDDAARWAGRTEEKIEDFPDDAARWAGRTEERIEDIPQDVENDFDDARQDVDRFEDRVEDNFDAGRDEQRYDDGY